MCIEMEVYVFFHSLLAYPAISFRANATQTRLVCKLRKTPVKGLVVKSKQEREREREIHRLNKTSTG